MGWSGCPGHNYLLLEAPDDGMDENPSSLINNLTTFGCPIPLDYEWIPVSIDIDYPPIRPHC